MDATTVLLTVAAVTGLYMAWNIGANDVANAMGTSVGSGALTLRGAIVVAAVFEFGGAMLVGGSVTQTISKGLIDAELFTATPMVLATGMTCCLLAGAIWLHVATYFGWPVSTTHSIVGAVLGFGVIAGGFDAVQWGTVLQVSASWVISPALGGLLGFFSFLFINKRILYQASPLEAMKTWGPIMVFPIFATLALSMIYKGLKPLKLDLSFDDAGLLALGCGTVATLGATPLLRRLADSVAGSGGAHAQMFQVERIFRALQILTACFVAFAHGSNDVANAVGPLSAVFSAINEGVRSEVAVQTNVLLIGAIGIVVGLATYGYRVMGTVGSKITELTPSRGFSAEFAAAMTIVIASKLGLPVSTTHTLVGSIVGVGFARSIGAINMQVVRGIVASWLVTVPFTAILAALLFLFARALI